MNTLRELAHIPARTSGPAYQARHGSPAGRIRTRAARAILLLGFALGIFGAVAPAALGHGGAGPAHPGARQPAVISHSGGAATAGSGAATYRPWMY
jgi:hypothetical protein